MERKFRISTIILDDLCTQFIYNVPLDERLDVIKFCSHVENAHWHYLEFYNKRIGFRRFALFLFKHVPFLSIHVNNVNQIVTEYNTYKRQIPRSGALLFNRNFEKLLLVQHSWPDSWGFPQGKIMGNEDPLDCAIREVYEETGLDLRTVIDGELFVEGMCQGRKTRLYVVKNISTSTVFHCVDNEIKSYKWFSVNDLLDLDKSTVNSDALTSYAFSILTEVNLFLNEHRRVRNPKEHLILFVKCFCGKFFICFLIFSLLFYYICDYH